MRKPLWGIETNTKNLPSIDSIASTLTQYSSIYGYALGRFSLFVGILPTFLKRLQTFG